MTKLELLLFAIFIFLSIIMLMFNIFIYKWIVNRAIKRYIKPHFIEQGYTIESKKFPGIFSSGAFKNQFLLGAFVMGWPSHNTYVDIYLVNESGKKKKATALISTLFLSIRNVKYRDYSN